MKSKPTIRYLGTAIAVCAILLPLSSQADVYWSLNLGDGLRISQSHYPVRHYQREVKHYGHRYHHHKSHKLQQYYWHHRVQQHHYFAPYTYGFMPRHHSHYGSHH